MAKSEFEGDKDRIKPILPGKVLVVDDEPTNRQILERILRKEHDVLSVESGPEALAVVASEKIDLILLDVMMPDMDGFEVCRRLKADHDTEKIPVIFVSAMGETANEARGLEVGGIDYITKPVNSAIVRVRVRNHLELKRHQDMLASLATLDGLTGIGNRRRFDEAMDQEWRRNQRDQSTLSVVLCDIDFFKQYNDEYGHLPGDECLKQVASALETAILRPSDVVARYGEEFVFLLPQTDSVGAMDVALRARDAVRGLSIPHQRSAASSHVTISLGVASAVPDEKSTAQALVAAADEALYRAKESGRDRVESKPTE